MRNNVIFTAVAALTSMEMEADLSGIATVTYCEVRRGLLKYHIFLNNGEYTICNAGDYQITDFTFDSFDAVLSYINNGEAV